MVTITRHVNRGGDHHTACEQETVIKNDNAHSLTLTTMHGAKGLEWPFVFVARVKKRYLVSSRLC